uniref:Uncharacterized protein n=1 Tax=Zea mays TaxID=4577 RepID=A0A804QSP7_MAIZE
MEHRPGAPPLHPPARSSAPATRAEDSTPRAARKSDPDRLALSPPQGYTVAATCPRPQKGAFAARSSVSRRLAPALRQRPLSESWSLPYLDAFGAAKNMHVYEVSFIDSWVLSLSPMRRAFLKAMRKSNNH